MTAADRILRKELEEWNAPLTTAMQRKGIQWDFIPANSPHRGGVWERVVGLFKRHLATQAYVEPLLHVDVLNTLIVDIEGIVNKRPLTALSTNPDDYEPITPAHILYPAVYAHSSSILVPVTLGSDADSPKASWKLVQSRVNSFWRIWSKEYVTTLHSRRKWQKTREDLKVDDLVMIVDENLRRSDWNLGRIISVDSEKGHVRKAEIKRADGQTLTRDRAKIVRLELDEKPSGQD